MAYDSVFHEILLVKLSKTSFRGNINSFLISYLENRYQSVTIGGNTSNLLEIRYGIPQGSVLGPLLFNLFTNNLTHLVSDDFPMIRHFVLLMTSLILQWKELRNWLMMLYDGFNAIGLFQTLVKISYAFYYKENKCALEYLF